MSDAEQRLLDAGYEDVKYLTDFDYDSALVGVTVDGRTVYSFDKMVTWLQETQGWTEEESIEWIEYNTIRALPYMGEDHPIVFYPLEGDDDEGP